LEGRFLLFHVLSGGPFDVSVDHAAQGPTTYPVRTLLLLEPSDDEFIEGVTITSGEGVIEWIVTGTEA
jgi:hypothetical protein